LYKTKTNKIKSEMPIKISHTSKPLGSLFIYLFIYFL